MSRFAAWLEKWTPRPVRYAGWEVFFMRLGFACLLWVRLPFVSNFTTQPSPNGAAHWLDLTFFAQSSVFEPIRWVFLVMLLLYIAGRWLFVALPYLLIVHLGVLTLGNSQGWIGHTDQIVALVLLVQTIFHFYRCFDRFPGDVPPGSLEVFYTQQTIAATYVVAGLTKLFKTSGLWIAQLPNITVQIVKTNDQFYYDSLTHPHPGLADWINNLILTHPWIAYPLFAPGLIVELSAVLILFGRKQALLIGCILLVMHGLINLVMQITFTTNIALIFIYLINLPWLLALGLQSGKRVFLGADR